MFLQVSSKKRAVRLTRTKKVEDPILGEQKKREEEEKKKKLEKEERKKRMEEELQREAEKKRKAEVAAALEAAKCKVTKKIIDPRSHLVFPNVGVCGRCSGNTLHMVSYYGQ